MTKLPTIDHPLFDVNVPSTKKKIKIRPMLVKEEKLLLMAKVSGTNADIYKAIKQVVNNCLAQTDIDVNKLTLFDLEYIFLKLRATSVSNVVKVIYKDAEDNKDYPFDIDLDKLEVKFPEDTSLKVATGTAKGFVMKYPLADLYNSDAFNKSDAPEATLIDELILNCIDSYFDGETVYKFSDNKKDDVKTFVDNLDLTSYNKIRDFVSNLPRLFYSIKYKNSLDHDRTSEMNTLSDFFTL